MFGVFMCSMYYINYSPICVIVKWSVWTNIHKSTCFYCSWCDGVMMRIEQHSSLHKPTQNKQSVQNNLHHLQSLLIQAHSSPAKAVWKSLVSKLPFFHLVEAQEKTLHNRSASAVRKNRIIHNHNYLVNRNTHRITSTLRPFPVAEPFSLRWSPGRQRQTCL